MRTDRRGSQQFDVRRFEGQLSHTWGGLFGADAKAWWVAPTRLTGVGGTASQAARTTAKVTMVSFRAVRDMHTAMDAWQDTLGRTLGLAAADARLLDFGRWADEVAASATGAARKLGPIAASLDTGPAERAALSRSKWFWQATFDAADDVTRLFGDSVNYTQRKQLVARRVVPFYGFARHSTRVLFNARSIRSGCGTTRSTARRASCPPRRCRSTRGRIRTSRSSPATPASRRSATTSARRPRPHSPRSSGCWT